MQNPRDLMHKADDLRHKAEHENDADIRARLKRMADSYGALAESQADQMAHPVDPAALGEVLTKGDH